MVERNRTTSSWISSPWRMSASDDREPLEVGLGHERRDGPAGEQASLPAEQRGDRGGDPGDQALGVGLGHDVGRVLAEDLEVPGCGVQRLQVLDLSRDVGELGQELHGQAYASRGGGHRQVDPDLGAVGGQAALTLREGLGGVAVQVGQRLRHVRPVVRVRDIEESGAREVAGGVAEQGAEPRVDHEEATVERGEGHADCSELEQLSLATLRRPCGAVLGYQPHAPRVRGNSDNSEGKRLSRTGGLRGAVAGSRHSRCSLWGLRLRNPHSYQGPSRLCRIDPVRSRVRTRL